MTITVQRVGGSNGVVSVDYATSNGTAMIRVSRVGGSGGAVSVQFSTSDGTATAGLDHTSMFQSHNWADGGAGGSGSVRVGFLVGDVNGSRAVTLADVLTVNAVLAQPVSASNFVRDLNLSGALTLADVLLVNSRLTQALPPPLP